MDITIKCAIKKSINYENVIYKKKKLCITIDHFYGEVSTVDRSIGVSDAF